ncbi:hypothetical protein [Paenibacillus sp. LK1]|uniref:hypothetical protein n=1 Tax=Paenibacillus sp. LK1 TaxID=2053014 RepID=UPI000C177A05|nr:hypothetical protein [Paenibacillus sp. LK1]PIH61522.1 hypothetical protein CS562_03700 [Paenibacillus sp. LK1]
MENNNQQFNEEQIKKVSEILNNYSSEYSKAVEQLGKVLVDFFKEFSPAEMGCSKEDAMRLINIVNSSEKTNKVQNKIDEGETKEQKVVRIYKEVGNKFAIATDGIGRAVQRSGDILSRVDDSEGLSH